MDSQTQAIQRFRFSVGLFLALRKMLLYVTLWGFTWGVVVIALRVAGVASSQQLLWGLAVIPIVMIVAGFLALRNLPTPRMVRAIIDRQSHSGGLVMAAEERKLGPWQGSLRSVSSPRLRWRGGKSWSLFLLSALFLLVCFLFPQRYVALASSGKLDITHEAEQLAKQIEVLEEEKILESDRAEEFKKRLDQLKKDAKGTDPNKTLEALDHLNQLTNELAKEAAEDAQKQTEKMTKAETLAEGLQEGAESLNSELMKEAMTELAEMANGAMGEEAEELDAEMQAALEAGDFSKEQLQQLSEALKLNKGQLRQMLGKLHAAKLIDLEALKLCEGLGNCDCEGLAAFLAENAGELSMGEMMDAWYAMECEFGGA